LAILYRAVVSRLAMVVHGRFDAQQTLDAIERAGITHMSLVENTLLRLLDAWGERQFPPTLRGVLVGGGPVDVELLRRARRLGLPVKPTYGLTEAASQVATLPLDAPATVLSSVGRPLPSCEVEIRDTTGNSLPAGVEGEITIRGPMVSRGYWESLNIVSSNMLGGWCATGDIGVLDDRGYLTVRGRADDMIVSGGEKMFPAEIEASLARVPWIRQAAVLGVSDPQWGRIPVAFIEILPGVTVDPSDVAATLADRLARFKIPKRFITVTQLPQAGGGKIDRHRLAEIYRERAVDIREIS
jgi:O-succinylbenzoic acid--CoA ligase